MFLKREFGAAVGAQTEWLSKYFENGEPERLSVELDHTTYIVLWSSWVDLEDPLPNCGQQEEVFRFIRRNKREREG
jgi:hypothetical protein